MFGNMESQRRALMMASIIALTLGAFSAPLVSANEGDITTFSRFRASLRLNRVNDGRGLCGDNQPRDRRHQYPAVGDPRISDYRLQFRLSWRASDGQPGKSDRKRGDLGTICAETARKLAG